MPSRYTVRNSPIHGKGVFAPRDLPAGEPVIEYRGRLLTTAQADRRYSGTANSGHTFLFTLNDDYVIDANFEGNAARWINHSCNPNCEAITEEDSNGNRRKDRVVIHTKRAVKAGEELTYDYHIVLEDRHTARMKALWECRCGSRRCTGTILKSKRKPPKPR